MVIHKKVIISECFNGDGEVCFWGGGEHNVLNKYLIGDGKVCLRGGGEHKVKCVLKLKLEMERCA